MITILRSLRLHGMIDGSRSLRLVHRQFGIGVWDCWLGFEDQRVGTNSTAEHYTWVLLFLHLADERGFFVDWLRCVSLPALPFLKGQSRNRWKGIVAVRTHSWGREWEWEFHTWCFEYLDDSFKNEIPCWILIFILHWLWFCGHPMMIYNLHVDPVLMVGEYDAKGCIR